MTRRENFQVAAATGLGLLAGARRLDAKAPATLGVQLYTVRDLIGTDPAGTLKAIAGIGYKEVEVIRSTMATVVPLARQDGLNPISVHADSVLITGNWDMYKRTVARYPGLALPEGYDLAACIRDVKAAGAKYIVMPYLAPPERPKDAAGFKAFGETLNKAGEQIRKAGLQLCYHNHAFEFTPLPDGRRALDVMLAAADPELVKLELDVFWVSVAGADPVALIKQDPGTHRPGAPEGQDEGRADFPDRGRATGHLRRGGQRRARLPGHPRRRRGGPRGALLRRAGSDLRQSGGEPQEELRVPREPDIGRRSRARGQA